MANEQMPSVENQIKSSSEIKKCDRTLKTIVSRPSMPQASMEIGNGYTVLSCIPDIYICI